MEKMIHKWIYGNIYFTFGMKNKSVYIVVKGFWQRDRRVFGVGQRVMKHMFVPQAVR